MRRRRVRSQTESEASRSTVSSTMAPWQVPDPSRNIQLSIERIGIVAGVFCREFGPPPNAMERKLRSTWLERSLPWKVGARTCL